MSWPPAPSTPPGSERGACSLGLSVTTLRSAERFSHLQLMRIALQMFDSILQWGMDRRRDREALCLKIKDKEGNNIMVRENVLKIANFGMAAIPEIFPLTCL